ncbi:MAG: DUF4116 domain-containing protein [Candidatus Rhabdochlamydia sp.]
MTSISHVLSPCNRLIASPPAVHTLQEGLQLIKTILQKELLCRHDIYALDKAYEIVCQQESESKQHSGQILKEIADRVSDVYETVETQQIINAYYLQYFKGSLTRNRFTPFLNSSNSVDDAKDYTKMKEVATYLSACIEQEELEADAKVLLGNELPEDVIVILKSARELFCKQEKIEERLKFLKQLRQIDASLYPPYFEEILQGGFFHLYDHLINMKQIPNHSEREIQEKKTILFSEFSHIILEFKEAVLSQAEQQIPTGSKTLFLLGDTGSGKSTTLCYLRKDKMTLHDEHYQSEALGTNLIGGDDIRSCTLFPNVNVSSDLTIVDFPGFHDTHGKVISFAIEIALRALVKKYAPKILVISSITDTEARFTHIVRLKDRLTRVLGTLDHCILGLTKYSKDPDSIEIKHIEKEQEGKLICPTAEENKLEGGIQMLLDLVQTMPALQVQLDEAKKQLLKLQEARAKNSPSSSEDKSRRLRNLKEREKKIQETMGIKNMIQLVDLANQNQLETILDTVQSHQKISPLPKYHQLDPGDKDFLDILFKEKLFQMLTSNKEHQLSLLSETVLLEKNLSEKIKAFEKSILETSLINTLLRQSHSEIGNFFHLEEMNPAIVREYDKRVIKGCIQDYIHEVISHLIVTQEVIKKFKEQFTPEQKRAVDHELSSLKQYILTLYGELSENPDQDQVNQAWQGLEKEHQKLIKNKEQELELSGSMTVLSLIPLAIPYGIFRLFKAIALGKTEATSIAKIADKLCGSIKASGRAIRDLQGIEKSVIAKDHFDEVFAKYPLSLESTESLKSSLSEQISQVKTIYGRPEWEAKITLLINQLEVEFTSQSENVLYGLMSQEVSWKDLPPYFNEHTYLALMHAFAASQTSYQESLKLLVPGWKAAYPQSLGLNSIHDFFYPMKITEKDYEELKVKGKILIEQYNRTPITRLLLIEAIIKLKEKSPLVSLDETRSLLNFSLQNDLEKIRRAARDDEWILEYSKEWVLQDKDFILSVIKLNEKALRCVSQELKKDHDLVMMAVQGNGEVLRYASEELRNDRDIVIAAVKKNVEALRHASEELRNNQDIVMAAVKRNVEALCYASEKLRADRDFVMNAIKENVEVLRYASEEIQNDRDFVIAAVKRNVEALCYAGEKLRADRNFVMTVIKENVEALCYACEELRADRDFVMAAVKQAGGALNYASKELQNDCDIVMVAVKRNVEALRYASEKLRNDVDFIMAIIQRNVKALRYASEKLRNDHDFIMAVIKENVEALRYSSENIRNDRDFVMAAVKQAGRALNYASKELKNDHNIVMAAVKQTGGALNYASEGLKNNRDIVRAAVKQAGGALNYASEELQNDRGFIMAIIKENVEALRYSRENIRKDRGFVMAVIKENVEAVYYASKELKNDYDIVMAAVKQAGRTLKYASQELKNDRDIVMAAVKQVGGALNYASGERRNDFDIVTAAVRQAGGALYYASQELKNDRNIVMAAVKQVGGALNYASEELKNDHDIVIAAVKQDGEALNYASKGLKNDWDVVMAAVTQAGWVLAYASKELKNDFDIVMTAVTQNGGSLEYASEELKNNRNIAMAAVKQAGESLKYASKELQNDRDLIELSSKSRLF